MKSNYYYSILLLLCSMVCKAQSWAHYYFPQHNEIYDIEVRNDCIWVRTVSGQFSRWNLDGGFQYWGTSDSMKLGGGPEYENTIFHGTLYYRLHGKLKTVAAPIYAGSPIGFDSKDNVYSIYADTLWKYDGLHWSALRITPDTALGNSSSGMLSRFVIDKTDRLWGTYYDQDPQNKTYNFLVDLNTMDVKYRRAGSFGTTLSENPPIVVDAKNNKWLAYWDTLYQLNDQNYNAYLQKIAIPDSLEGVSVGIPGGFEVDKVLHDSVVFMTKASATGPILISYDGHEWQVYNNLQIENYYAKQDGLGNSWKHSGFELYRNNGIRIDTMIVTNTNDTMNLCYQDTLKKHLDEVKQLGKDASGKIWVYSTEHLPNHTGNTGWVPTLTLDLLTCTQDFGRYPIFEGVGFRDKSSAVWRFYTQQRAPEVVSTDTLAIQKYVNGAFRNINIYRDYAKPLLNISVLDEAGSFWGIYGENFTTEYGNQGTTITFMGYKKTKLIQFDGNTWNDYGSLDDKVISAQKGRNAELWVLTKTKVMRYKNKEWSSYSLPTQGFVNSVLALDEQGYVWYGKNYANTDSLYRFDGNNWLLKRTSMPYNVLYQGSGMTGVWCSISENGLIHSVDGNTWTHYDQSNGLLNNFVHDIKFDTDGTLWAISDKGVSTLSKAQILSIDDTFSNETAMQYAYPNPVIDKLYLPSLGQDTKVSIFSSAGKVVLQQESLEDYLDVSALEQGLYMLKIQDKDKSSTLHFIKN